jgi:hypothetical protein
LPEGWLHEPPPTPMPKVLAEDRHVAQVAQVFALYEGLEHLRVRRHADLVVVESGQAEDPIPHARFRRTAAHLWVLEMANHTARWQPSGARGALDGLVEALINDFGWTLSPDR